MDIQFIESQADRLGIKEPEETLGKGLLQPFNVSNSRGRKQMFITENAQKVQLIHPEVPYINTGYENKYGELSSCFIQAEADLQIVAKIPKFSKHKNHIFYVIFYNTETRKYDVFEASPYNYITEFYGYLKDNSFLESSTIGSTIKKGAVMSKSNSYDEFNNRMDGVNLLTCYMMNDGTKQDSVMISESASKKLAFPMIKKIQIAINENDIPRNSYGDNNTYKFIPDILECTKNKLLCGIRRQKNEDSLYTQAEERLSKIQFGDDNFIAEGQVIDIEIYCNNPERLGTTTYDDQLKYYYDEKIRLCNDIITIVDAIGGPQNADHNLQSMYYTAADCIAGKKYKKQTGQVFSNISLEVTVLNKVPITPTDKIANRYGGKGVISSVVPDEMMPHTLDGRVIDVIQTKNTVIRRENIGQSWEMEVNHIGGSIVNTIRSGVLPVEEGFNMYRKFIRMVSEQYSDAEEKYFDNYSEQDIEDFVESIQEEDYIYVTVRPVQDNMTLDKLSALYKEFPMAKPEHLLMPIESSNNDIEYVYSSRPIVYGPIYYYRLKQMGEEKMSATSLSATNLKGYNAKSKLYKKGMHLYKESPVSNGNQEYMDYIHMSAEQNLVNAMIYSNSPMARKNCVSLLTGDPFNPNVELDDESTNRSAEICAVYLKTKGIRVEIEKTPKSKYVPFVVNPFVDGFKWEGISTYDEIVDEFVNSLSKKPELYNPFIVRY